MGADKAFGRQAEDSDSEVEESSAEAEGVEKSYSEKIAEAEKLLEKGDMFGAVTLKFEAERLQEPEGKWFDYGDSRGEGPKIKSFHGLVGEGRGTAGGPMGGWIGGNVVSGESLVKAVKDAKQISRGEAETWLEESRHYRQVDSHHEKYDQAQEFLSLYRQLEKKAQREILDEVGYYSVNAGVLAFRNGEGASKIVAPNTPETRKALEEAGYKDDDTLAGGEGRHTIYVPFGNTQYPVDQEEADDWRAIKKYWSEQPSSSS